MMHLLSEIDDPALPLSRQLDTAARQLSAMHNAGELAALPDDTRVTLAALALFLMGAADRVRDMEQIASDNLPRMRRMTPISELMARIVARATP